MIAPLKDGVWGRLRVLAVNNPDVVAAMTMIREMGAAVERLTEDTNAHRTGEYELGKEVERLRASDSVQYGALLGRALAAESRLAAAIKECTGGAVKYRLNPDVAQTYREILAILAAQPAAPHDGRCVKCWCDECQCRPTAPARTVRAYVGGGEYRDEPVAPARTITAEDIAPPPGYCDCPGPTYGKCHHYSKGRPLWEEKP